MQVISTLGALGIRSTDKYRRKLKVRPGFPCCPEVERSCERWNGIKWRNSYLRSHHPNGNRLNRDKTQTLTVQSYDGLMLRCWVWFLGKELGGTPLATQGAHCLNKWHLLNKCRTLFSLFCKSSGPLWISFV